VGQKETYGAELESIFLLRIGSDILAEVLWFRDARWQNVEGCCVLVNDYAAFGGTGGADLGRAAFSGRPSVKERPSKLSLRMTELVRNSVLRRQQVCVLVCGSSWKGGRELYELCSSVP
jgi:hypothetical protein